MQKQFFVVGEVEMGKSKKDNLLKRSFQLFSSFQYFISFPPPPLYQKQMGWIGWE